LPSFYRHGKGAVLSAAVRKYVYVMVGRKFDNGVRISHSKTENADVVEDLNHDLIRECLTLLNLKSGIEVVTMADVPGHGTGLGSSSAPAVGLLNA